MNTAKNINKNTKNLSVMEQEALAFIRRFLQENNYSPDVREITDGLGWSSSSVTAYRLSALRRKGALHFSDRTARTYHLPGQKITFSSSEQ